MYNSDMNHHYRKFGFTLSEVLITLGIIGVVAALTLPVFNIIQEKHFHEKWKECYSILNNAFVLVVAENPGMVVSEANSYDLTREFVDAIISKLKVIDTCGFTSEWDDGICDNYYYINSRKKYPWAGVGNVYSVYLTLAGGRLSGYDLCNKVALLANGAAVHFGDTSGSGYTILVDVNNAQSGPNVVGRDVYAINLPTKYSAASVAYSKTVYIEDLKFLPYGAVGTTGQSNSSMGTYGCSKDIGEAETTSFAFAAGAGCSYKYLSE